MATFKVRRLLTALGGLTTASLNVNTGSTTINASGIGVGGGTLITKILHGSGTATATSCAAASSGSILITVANLAATNPVFFSAGSMAACAMWTAASATAASVLTVKFYNAGSAAMADTPITYTYLAVAG